MSDDFSRLGLDLVNPPLACAFISLARIPRGVRNPFRMHARIYTGARARVEAPRPRGCVGACNAREMRRTTIQILLLLLREQSPVNRPPRHNVSIQVRSAVLNRSGSTLCESRKNYTIPMKTIVNLCTAEIHLKNSNFKLNVLNL